jgi:hypothetical protein
MVRWNETLAANPQPRDPADQNNDRDRKFDENGPDCPHCGGLDPGSFGEILDFPNPSDENAHDERTEDEENIV